MAGRHASEVEIRDGLASAGIAPNLGGGLSWFRWDAGPHGAAIDWLRPATTDSLNAGDVGAMACFPLLPYSNRVRSGRFSFNGRQVSLPVTESDPNFEHGHGWRASWTVVRRTPASVVLRYRHDADAWPWSYQAEQDIALQDGALIVRLTLKNLSSEPMPAGFGLHPYFPASPGVRVEAEVGGMWETDEDILPLRYVELPRELKKIEIAATELDNVFTGWSRHARIVWPERSLSLGMEAGEPFDFLVVYSPRGEDFFCCEPVSNATDAFNLNSIGVPGTGMFVLEPDEARTAVVRFAPGAAEAFQS